MRKSDLNIQNENAILLAIAIADGYFPVNEEDYDKEIEKRIKNSGIDNYKQAFNQVYASMPQYVGDNAIYAGRISLVGSDGDYLDFALGNNEQYADKYIDISRKIIATYIDNNLPNSHMDINAILQDKYTMYSFLKTYVLPKLLKDRYEILAKDINTGNILHNFNNQNILNTLFDYKFSAFKHYQRCRGNKDQQFYSLTHGMIDAVVDLYGSLVTALDEKDIDIRSISPYPNEELGIDLPEDSDLIIK